MGVFKDFSNRILSITDYGETHHLLHIFGFKLKFPKYEYRIKRRENPYHYYKKNNVDITTLPPAQGQIRDIQLANLALLKELDYVCKQNNIQYWIDFGSVLGAVRHKGFIPWDDDVDTGMLREDYNRIIDAFKKSSRNPDIFADYVRSGKNSCQYIIKVQHKKCPHLFVDIFPYDFYGKILSTDEQLSITKEFKSIRKQMENKCSSECSVDNIQKVIEDARKNIIQNTENKQNTDLVWGIDFNHNWKNWFSSYDTVFPLKEISFEGEKFSCMNNYELYLSGVYGNYMDYPKKIGVGHNMFARLGDEESFVISELIAQQKNKKG